MRNALWQIFSTTAILGNLLLPSPSPIHRRDPPSWQSHSHSDFTNRNRGRIMRRNSFSAFPRSRSQSRTRFSGSSSRHSSRHSTKRIPWSHAASPVTPNNTTRWLQDDASKQSPLEPLPNLSVGFSDTKPLELLRVHVPPTSEVTTYM